MVLGFHILSAQSFFGFQSPFGTNNFFVSLAWQDGEPHVGTGYIHRIDGSSFTDLQAEIRFPLKGMYRCENYEVIAGMYRPFSIERWFLGAGVHLRWEKYTENEQKSTQLSLALSALPSYTYASSLTDGLYGTMALRATYAPVLFGCTQTPEGKNQQAFARHKIEIGGHFDALANRSLSLSLNGIMQRSFYPANSILGKDISWKREGDFYLGAGYRLDRY